MKTITIEELEKASPDAFTVIDIRKEEDYKGGTYPGAISIPRTELVPPFYKLKNEPFEDRPLCLMGYTGTQSEGPAEMLEAEGYEVYNLAGGYRSYLCLSMERICADEEALKERTREIERSITKKYKKSIWRGFTKSLHEYDLVKEGDKIAVCISGGKDSMLLAKLFQELKKHGKFPFEVVFLCMDPGYNDENRRIIEANAKLMGIPLTTFKSEIFDAVVEIDRNPCYLCARMRRGFLYAHAKELGCNKIALGHHFDDVIETILMGMLYAGKIETMMPKLHSQNFEGMELIRPMYLVREADIKSWRDHNELHFLQCACRFTENNAFNDSESHSKRDEMTELIAQFRKTSEVIDKNIFRSVHDINLNTVIGYHKGEMRYNFLDDYDK